MADERPPRYVVTRAAAKGRGGFVLALFVCLTDDGASAKIRRLVGQSYRLSRPRVAKEMVVPAADIIRDATPRELALGYPV